MSGMLSKLKASPSSLEQGSTKVKMTYKAIVDQPSDDPVSLTLRIIEDESPVFFIEDGNREKSITTKKVLNTVVSDYVWQTEIKVTQTPDVPMACKIRIEFTDGNGKASNTFITYK